MILRDTLLYLPAQVIGPACQFLAVIAWTFWLAPAELGKFNLIVALQELIYLPTLYGWGHYTLRSYGGLADDAERARFQGTESAVLGLGLVANVVLLAVTIRLFVEPDAGFALLAAAAFYGGTRSLLTVLAERMRATRQIASYSVLQIAASAGGLLLGLGLATVMGGTTVAPLLGFAAAQAAALIWVVRRAGMTWPSMRLDRGILTAAFGYASPLILAAIITWAGLYCQRFIVDTMVDRAAVGIYSVGSGLAERSLMFMAFLVAPAVFPIAVREANAGSMERAMARLADGMTFGLLLIVPAVAGLMLLSGPIAATLVGEAYRTGAAAILPVAALAAGLTAIWTLMPAQTLLLHRRTDLNVRIEAAGTVASIALGLVLVYTHGVVGAAVARVVASVIVLVVGLVVGAKCFDAVYPWREFAGVAAATAIMTAVLWPLPPPVSLAGIAVQVAAGAAVYGLCIAILFRKRLLDIGGRAGLLGSA